MSIISRLPRPLLGNVLEFIGEKWCVEVEACVEMFYDIPVENPELRVIRRYVNGPFIITFDGKVQEETMDLAGTLEDLFHKWGAFTPYFIVDDIMESIDICYPYFHEYAY